MENQRFKSCFKSIQELRLIQWALALTTKPQGQSKRSLTSWMWRPYPAAEIVEGMEARWLAAMVQNDFFFVTASFWLHFYPCWSWCAYSFIPFILGVENFEPSPSKTSHHFPHQNCWTLWETGRDLIWSDEMPLLKPDVKPQNEARFDHFASTQGMIFTIYNQQPLGHWGLIPR